MVLTPWIAILMLASSGLLSVDIKPLSQVPMQSREACQRFANETSKTASPNIAVICISTETGEIFSTVGQKK